MFVRCGREAPSVVSMRVLRTHRKNSVETFRLQERVKTIDFESQHNYSQISDEIVGVRQNLDKIKGIKRNVGVSVERRKLLRDKGLRILPSNQNGDDYFTVRTSGGKDIVVSCTEFYDGNIMRKRLSIDMRELKATPCLPDENSDSDEPIDSTSGGSRGKCYIIAENMRTNEFRYRNISPPLRPGSRRNFKDVDDENSENGEKLLLKNISSMQKKCGIAYLKRKRQMLLRPTSRTYPTIVESDETITTPQRKLSRKHSGVVGNSRKTSLVTNSVENQDKSNEQPARSNNNKHQVCNDNVVSEDAISLSPSVRPRLRPRLMTTGVILSRSGISSTTVGIRRISVDEDKPIQLPPTPSGYTWAQPATSPEPCSSDPEKTVVTVDNDNETTERKVSMPRKNVLTVNKDDENSCKILERKKDNVQDNGSNHIKGANLIDDFPNYPIRRSRIGSSLSNSSHEGRAQSASQPRPSMARDHNFASSKVSKMNGRRSNQDFVHDVRPNNVLSKGYVTMQMTIGKKQVKVYVSKFSTGECLDNDVVERARAKSAFKASVGINRPLPRSNR